jgi:translation initiation factor 2 subunit 2
MEELYTTDFLLERLFDKLESRGNKKKFSLKKPIVDFLNRKTYIKNFVDLCKMMNREQLHLKTFMDKDLNTNSSVNEENSLLLDKKYTQVQIENTIAKYVKKFVICQEPKCGSGDTKLIKENHITFLECKGCCSKKSIDDK